MRTISPPQPSRVRIFALIAVAVLFVLFLSANGVASFYTDWLWFDNMDFGSIWTTILGTKLLLAVIFTTIFFVILWGNLYLADRLKPETRPESPEEDLVERYHAVVGAQAGKVRFAIAAVFGLIAGANTSSQWDTWLLFRNGGDFGQTDALFNEDVGFYVFRLPFWTFVVDWFFAALVLTLIVVMVAHYLNGGIRASVPQDRISSGVKLHVSVLLAILALIRAAAYWLDRFHLLTSTRGKYDGALATDVNIQLPALNLLVLISLFCAALFVANIRRSGWGLPAVAIGIWLVSHFVIGGIFPLVYQRVRIQPEESQREIPFVERNIQATRFAYGLDSESVTEIDFTYDDTLTAADVAEFDNVLSNIPVIDPALATEEVTRSQAERSFYEFSSVLDIDRYKVGDEVRPVLLSARGLNVSEVGDSWERQHVIFTHGHGLAMAAAFDETATVSGESRTLDFLVKGLGESDIQDGFELELEQPRIYFGENMGGYAIVGAARQEVDFQTRDDDQVLYSYTGDGGVPMGSFLRRVAYALRFRELDPLISRNVTDTSKVIYNREISDRVQQVAPFIRFDEDPYPVAANGGLFWVIDGYTTTSEFPYSQSVSTTVPGSLSRGYNYVRNSVKAVVDAYNGTITMYIVDDEDPLVAAWAKAFPDLFTDGSEIPQELREHFRYPKDIFSVQTDMWSDYVVDEADKFIEGGVAWSVAAQPRIEAQEDRVADPAALGSMQPQYLMARIPQISGDEPEFVLQRAFVPRSGAAGTNTARPKLTGIMMARSDPANYGELVLVNVPGGVVDAPDLAHSEIRKNDVLTEFILRKPGARVEFGTMNIVLVDDTIVYVRPVYVESNSDTAVPELQRVVAVNDNRIFVGGSIAEAVRGVVGSGGSPAAEPDESSEPAEDSAVPDEDYDPEGKSVVQLIADANQLLADADDADDSGFPEEAAQMRSRATAAIAAAQDLLGGATPTTTTTTPSPIPDVGQTADEEDPESAAPDG